jgi:hypothetical protein
MSRAKNLSLSQLTSVFALAFSILFTQFVGQHHRIEHTKWQAGTNLQRLVQTPYDGFDETRHSCVTFDATTLAQAIGAALAIAMLVGGTHMLAQWIACISWDAPVTPHFLSRAPPVVHQIH